MSRPIVCRTETVFFTQIVPAFTDSALTTTFPGMWTASMILGE